MSASGIKMHWEKTGARSGGNLSGLKVVPTCPVTGLTKASSCHKGAGCTRTEDGKEKECYATQGDSSDLLVTCTLNSMIIRPSMTHDIV